jgi:hypothetical protein
MVRKFPVTNAKVAVMSVESGRKIAKAIMEANENFGVKRKANHSH